MSLSSPFSIPMEINYNGQKRTVVMGSFRHSMEREFMLATSKRAIDGCTDIVELKKVASNMLTLCGALQTASQDLMLENIKLRQVLSKKETDLGAAEQIIAEAAAMIDTMQKQRQNQSRPFWEKLLSS